MPFTPTVNALEPLPFNSPVRELNTGALVKVCVPAHTLLVVVPKARDITGVLPPEERTGYKPETEVTVPLLEPKQTLLIEKHPCVRLIPLLPVDVAAKLNPKLKNGVVVAESFDVPDVLVATTKPPYGDTICWFCAGTICACTVTGKRTDRSTAILATIFLIVHISN